MVVVVNGTAATEAELDMVGDPISISNISGTKPLPRRRSLGCIHGA